VIFHSYVSLPGRVTEKDTIGYDLTTHQRPRWPLGILKTSRNLPPEQEHGDVPHQRGERRSPFLKMGVLPNQGDFGRIFWDFLVQQKLREFFSRLKPGDVTLTHRDLTSKKSMEAVMPEDQGNAI